MDKIFLKILQCFLLVLIWLHVNPHCANASVDIAGYIDIQIDLIHNNKRMLDNSTCCDGAATIHASDYGPYLQCPMSTSCNTFFVFCVSSGLTNNCHFGNFMTPVLGANSFKMKTDTVYDEVREIRTLIPFGNQSINNFYRFPINYRNDGLRGASRFTDVFTVRVQAFHKDLRTNQTALIADSGTFTDKLSPHNKWRHRKHKSSNSLFAYHVKVSCAKGWFRATCQKWCNPEEVPWAKFSCDAFGNRKCDEGWTGEFCRRAVCDNCNEQNGHCHQPGTCACRSGWQLPSCNNCIARHNCQHGYCIKPYECICESGWTGELCNIEINPCKHEPCIHGSCENKIGGGFTCRCEQGYTGQHCQLAITPCQSSPCENDGECMVVSKTHFNCSCLPGFAGPSCSIDINDCVLNNTCKNGGVCIDKINTHECQCTGGWDGVDCTEERDECLSNPCQNAYSCTDLFNDFHCMCEPGWTGKYCEVNINECKGQCRNNANCTDLVNKYLCFCPAGYTGENCEVDINDCASAPCQNQGVCIDLLNDYKCHCQTGFYGKTCEKEINKCLSNPCLHSGNCTQSFNDYKCDCSDEWTGRNCEKPSSASDCRSSKLCRFGSTCVVQNEQEICICQPGYTGKFCEVDIDDCYNIHCQNSGSCIDRVEEYKCVCQPGFTGHHCETNINECLQLNKCENNSTCIDGINTYTCLCEPGFQGYNCALDINDCENVVCRNGGSCVDHINGYECKCPVGIHGDNCELGPDYCSSLPCFNNGNCSVIHGGFHCQCVPGYTGQQCDQELNMCLSQPCANGAACMNQRNQYKCFCTQGYHGPHCEYLDTCSTNPCMNGSTCISAGNDYNCVCSKGFYGRHCDQVEDSCMVLAHTNSSHSQLLPSGVCSENGKCVALPKGAFKCECDDGWKGERCEIDIDDCINNLCQNGATCLDVELGYECICPSGFTDRYCQTDIDECTSNPCSNNSTCINLHTDFVCDCKDNWKGKTCSSKTSNCEPSPCLNNGHCTDLGNNFQCQCQDGYDGATCSNVVSRCTSDTCFNGGTCISLDSQTITCHCRPGFHGEHCETNPDDCASNPCLNGGKCVDRADWRYCECQPGFKGSDCEDEVDECKSNPCPDYMECIDMVGQYRCVCPIGKTGKFCQENAVKKSCKSDHQYTYHHNDTWQEDCNTCLCNDGHVECTKVWCGPVNCYDNRRYTNCTCKAKSNIDCITPPCETWGECNLRIAQSTDILCQPTYDQSEVTKHCAKVLVKFQKMLLPPGVSSEKICEEFRYLDVLKSFGTDDTVYLECRRESFDANINEMIISVYRYETAARVALEMAEYFQMLRKSDNVLYRLRQALIEVTIHRNPTSSITQQTKPYMIPTISGIASAVGLFLIILLVVLIWFYRRRKKEKNHILHDDIFFRKQKNILTSVKSTRTVNSTTCTLEKVKNCDKQLNDENKKKQKQCQQDKHVNIINNDEQHLKSTVVSVQSIAPDKLYISEPTHGGHRRKKKKENEHLVNLDDLVTVKNDIDV